MRFTLNGEQFELTARDVRHRLSDSSAETIKQYGVRIGPSLYPVKQVFEAATGIPRSRFTTQTARWNLAKLGFEVVAPHSPQGTITPEQGDQNSHRRTARTTEPPAVTPADKTRMENF